MITKERSYNAVQEILEVENREDLLQPLCDMNNKADRKGEDCLKDMICLLYDAFVTKSR